MTQSLFAPIKIFGDNTQKQYILDPSLKNTNTSDRAIDNIMKK